MPVPVLRPAPRGSTGIPHLAELLVGERLRRMLRGAERHRPLQRQSTAAAGSGARRHPCGGLSREPDAARRGPTRACPLRDLVNKAFLPSRVAQLEPAIETIADDLIDRFIDDGCVDLVEQFAVGLPLTVIADALGVDRADLARFKRWSDDIVAPRSGLLPRDDLLAATRSLIEFQHYMAERCGERRAEPRDDMLSDLVSARLATGERAGEPLTLNEVIGSASFSWPATRPRRRSSPT
jgi:cytochrome P450